MEVPLSAQNVALPRLTEASVRAVTARALYNDDQLALLIEWQDETQDGQAVRSEDFTDSVAVQFPLTEGEPFFCMGQQGGNVNIWHWKASWQADLVALQDLETAYPNMFVDYYPFTETAAGLIALPSDYTDPNYLPALVSDNLFASLTRSSPVEDLVAGGFGSLTSQPAEEQNVAGYGAWSDGKWQVIFSRALSSEELDDIRLDPGRVYPVAFAAWDGARGERNGQKSTSQWVSLQFERAAPSPAAQPTQAPAPAADNRELLSWIVLGVAALLLIGGTIVYFLLPNE